MKERICCGIPTKDRLLELSLLLQSLLYQTYQDFDVLIINDWSSDILNNTTLHSIIKTLKESDHEVIIIKGERKGPHIAGQKILENSKHELILRLDDDVSLRPTFIEELVSVFQTEKNVAAVGPIYLNPHEPFSNQIIDPNLSKEFLEQQGKVFWDDNGHLFLTGWLNVNIHPTEDLLQVEHLNSGFMYRKSVGLEIGGYFLDFSPVGHREESDFSFRLSRTGRKLFINPKAIAMHTHPFIGGIRETDGKMLSKQNWDHDEKLFLDRMEKWLPKPNKIKTDSLTSVIILTYGIKHQNLYELLQGISKYTNHNCEYIVFNNDTLVESQNDVVSVINEFPSMNILLVSTTKELPVSSARNEAVKFTSYDSKFICFIDDDARILGRYNQVTDWVDYLYNRFHEQPDVGCVSPIVTWFDDFQTHVASVSCLFTSKKVWEVVGGFDSVFGNKKKQTWGYEDTDWSYRCFLRGFKIVRVKGMEFPFYHADTTFKEKSPEQEKALLNAREYLLTKYPINNIKEYNRTVYSFTDEQININGLRLNLGSYYMYLDGFVNIDIKTDIDADLICDIRNLETKFSQDTVELILCSHNLEHITIEEAKNVLKTIHKILKPGGIFIVEVPNCEDLEEKVANGIIDEKLRQTCKYGCPQEFGQKHEAEYTRESLKKLLNESGFINIVENPNTSLGINFNLRSEAFRYDCRK